MKMPRLLCEGSFPKGPKYLTKEHSGFLFEES